jgi:hypothetical protein
MKFGRTYIMTVQPNPVTNPGGKLLTIPFPITMEFDVVRNTFASANTATFRIMNLGPDLRKQIFHDRYSTGVDQQQQILVQAGYNSNVNTPLATIFSGDILWAYSVRQKENWITQIECFDGGVGMLNGQVQQTIPAPYDVNFALQQLAKTLPGVATGTIAIPPSQNSRGIVLKGNSWDLFRKIAGTNEAFIDNGKVNCVAPDNYIIDPNGIPLISSDTGLLNTPRKLGALIEVDMVFEPRIVVNQLVQLESLEAYYNGQYIVKGIAHRGTISGAVCGQAITRVSLWAGIGALTMAAAA